MHPWPSPTADGVASRTLLDTIVRVIDVVEPDRHPLSQVTPTRHARYHRAFRNRGTDLTSPRKVEHWELAAAGHLPTPGGAAPGDKAGEELPPLLVGVVFYYRQRRRRPVEAAVSASRTTPLADRGVGRLCVRLAVPGIKQTPT